MVDRSVCVVYEYNTLDKYLKSFSKAKLIMGNTVCTNFFDLNYGLINYGDINNDLYLF